MSLATSASRNRGRDGAARRCGAGRGRTPGRLLVRNDRRRAKQTDDLLRGPTRLLEMIAPEAGCDPTCIETVDVSAVLDELAAEFAAVHPSSPTVLRWRHAAGIVFETDRRKLLIILKNLVANALTFTPNGEVRIETDLRGERCAFTVRDTGVGIASDRLPVIFAMFRHSDSSDTRSHGGGGLSLVERFLDQLGGDIAVASAPGRGTTCTVTLPVRAARSPTA